ncbi:MAG: hypothetical protein K2L47_00790, partial [Clostridia bacterium]|nr:hypothetical protein [Clostridia bacterium]
ERITIADELKVGIISDSQIPPKQNEVNGNDKQNLINSLLGLKANGVNMIIFAGDIGDEASNYVYDQYIDSYKQVYGTDFNFTISAGETFNAENPLVQTIMGNHDYWGAHDGMLTKSSYRKRFEKKLGHSPFTHYVVNGYHFIGASPEQGSPMDNQYKTMSKWLDKQISEAVADDPNKPVFVTTHNSPKNTVYGSEDWGDKKLYDVFAKYPQVVNISGHLHYSILDERSMWQGDFTAFSTQSVSYTELETGKSNGTIPPNADITPMGEIIEFETNRLVIKRMNFGKKDSLTGFYGVEEKENMRWELPIPISKDKFTYTNEQKLATNLAPSMDGSTGTFSNDGNKTFISFNAGSDDDFVHSYKLIWSNGNDNLETLYFTDFINGI